MSAHEEREAYKIEEETPALPGDIIKYESGYTETVRRGVIESSSRYDTSEYVVYVDGEDPVEVILKGGDTCFVMPLKRISREWPPKNADVWRDGVLVYQKGKAVPQPTAAGQGYLLDLLFPPKKD